MKDIKIGFIGLGARGIALLKDTILPRKGQRLRQSAIYTRTE